MKKPVPAPQCIAHIRDFFAATALEKRKAPLLALLALLEYLPLAPPAEPSPDFCPEYWLSLEYNFTHLFVGPGPVLAPPYASVYIETDRLLMGRSTLRVRALLHALGLHVPHEEQNPDDFLPYELDLYLALLQNPAQSSPDSQWFLHEHLPQWIPLFLQQARPHATHPALIQVLDVLESSLSEKSPLTRISRQ